MKMTDQDLKEIDSRIGSITDFVGQHFVGLKSQIANQPVAVVAKLESIEKKLDQSSNYFQSSPLPNS